MLPDILTSITERQSTQDLLIEESLDGLGFFGLFTAERTVDSSLTLDEYDGTMFCDVSGGAITLTLPSANGIGGRIYVIVDTGSASGSNRITIDTTGGDTISGASTVTILVRYQRVIIQSDGTNWFIIN